MLEEYKGSGIYQDRSAWLFYGNHAWFVICYDKNERVKTVDYSTHSKYYGEDIAENWINGIMKN